MVDIKAGDSVKLPDGTVVKVLGYYNQGKHRIFKLEGNETIMDLHKMPDAEIVVVEERPTMVENYRSTRRPVSLPKIDHED